MSEELRGELLRRVAVDQWARRNLDMAAITAADGVGLGSLTEYLAIMAGQHPPEPMRALCPACGATIEAWPPDTGETSTGSCPRCGLVLTFRLGG